MATTEPRPSPSTPRPPAAVAGPAPTQSGPRPPEAGAPPSQPPAGATDQAGAAAAAVADPPKLAPRVHLSEAMEESAFVEPQWLVQRDGKFIQLTELLYRVVENVDGQRSLAEIAERVGDAIDRDVTDDNIRQLIATKLIPLGLVAGADGSVATPESEAEGAARSPLQVNMKMAMISPGTIRKLTTPLTFLYWPPVLLATLAVCALAQGWLYFVHGVGAGVHDVLYNPHLLLIVLGTIVLATGFHELGHAAALHYGGGEVRGMGAGIYLIYPAFYTDVTDNYRLGRWGRVRTDLGGIYFSLIWAAGTIGLFMLTGSEFLLASVILLNIQTVQQLLPFVRLDGYWVLADITGIPDFFSHMGAFLRSVLPIKWEGRKLPELKWWAKAVFAGYLLIVLPLLAFLVFVTIKSLPRIAATTWDSFRQQLGSLAQAWAGGDGLAIMAGLVSTIALALPMLGLVYMLYNLGKAGIGLLWRWSEGSPPKRVAATGIATAVAGLLVFLWAPQLPLLGRPGPLYAAAAPDFRPIAPDERATLGDALAGSVVHVPLSESRPETTYARATEVAAAPTAATPLATGSPAPGEGTPAATPSVATSAGTTATFAATASAAGGPTSDAARATASAATPSAEPTSPGATGALAPAAGSTAPTPVPTASGAAAATGGTTGRATAPQPATATPAPAPPSSTPVPAAVSATAATTPAAGTPAARSAQAPPASRPAAAP
jgi:putative peptide zinc metalloprotease protein